MTHNLKLLATSVLFAALAGCSSTSVTKQTENVIDTNMHPQLLDEVKKASEPNLLAGSIDASSDSSSEIKIQELVNTISDDFNKKMMLIDMECQSYVDFTTGVEPPQIQSRSFDDMAESAQQLLSDMAERMGDNPDPSLQFAYEQEVARLKLEFRLAELEQKLTDVEFQKARELSKIDRLSSKLYECAALANEAKAEMERQLQVVKLGQNVSNVYDPAIAEINHQLLDVRYELDLVNSESFDGDWAEDSQAANEYWGE